jgi:hypothetical protein
MVMIPMNKCLVAFGSCLNFCGGQEVTTRSNERQKQASTINVKLKNIVIHSLSNLLLSYSLHSKLQTLNPS